MTQPGAGLDLGVGSWPWRRARMDPDRVAFRQADRAVGYAELAGRVDRLAGGLARLGIGRGDRVAYLGPNDIATFETFFAAGRLGAVFVPLNIRLAGPELEYQLADAGVGVLVHDPALPAPRGVRAVRLGDEFAALSTADPVTPATVQLADPALILYTSGTTGRPKGAVLSHGNITFNTVNQLAHLDVLRGDTVICTAPLFHVTGLGQVSLPTLFKGGTVVVAPRFDPAWLLAAIAAHRAVAFSAVPTMLQLLCDCPEWTDADLSSLRYVVYGGSPAVERVARAWLDRGVEVLQGYGMTEAAPGVLMAQPGDAADRPLSAGVPHFFTEVGVRAAGELVARGPNIFTGYWQRPAETAAVLDADGWFRSGDVVRFEDGHGYVVDRVQDMIISGGENIYPVEVEAVLGTAPGVVDCAVVGVPDERWGEVGRAFLVTGPDYTEAGLRAYAEQRLARYKIPKHLTLVDEIPRTATGKIRRDQLRQSPVDRPVRPTPGGTAP
jgi:fatty-acyl-CoA synthase